MSSTQLEALAALLVQFFPNTNCWIAGGAVRDALAGNDINDIDVFFADGVDVKAAADRLVREHHDDFFAAELSETPNAYKVEIGNVTFDLVKVTAASPQATIRAFDFTMCCAAITRDGTVMTHPDFEQANHEKRLTVLHMVSPLNTLRRVQKYVARGYTLSFEQLVVVMVALREMDQLAFNAEVNGLRACGGNPS